MIFLTLDVRQAAQNVLKFWFSSVDLSFAAK